MAIVPVFAFGGLIIVIAVISAIRKEVARRGTPPHDISKTQQDPFAPYEPKDGNGRTQHQRDYLNGLRAKKSQSHAKPSEHSAHAKTVVGSDGHSHIGDEEEHYEEIVGSLGDVNDEGCIDLDGVRLIAHDLAYEGEESQRDYTEVAKAIVLGDVLGEPRCKRPYGKK